LIRNNSEIQQSRLIAALDGELGRHHLTAQIHDSRLHVELDGKRTGFSTLASQVPVILFSPESLAAIKDGPDSRRRLIDEGLLTRGRVGAQLLRDYSRTLRARNALLKQLMEGDQRAGTRDSLASLTSIFLVLGAHLASERTQLLRELLPFWRAAFASITQREPESLGLRYEVSGQESLEWTESQIFDVMSQRQKELAGREVSAGSSLVGPHKHDLKFLVAENDSRFFASQGQQRALILAFKIAQINLHRTTVGRYPILLLDDVMSELDADKRSRLMQFLEGISAQVLLSATDLTWSPEFAPQENAVFSVNAGEVRCVESRDRLDHLRSTTLGLRADVN
jgi:DNA replication and repair protein RecF